MNTVRDVRRRRRGAGFNAIVAILLACGVFVCANILSLKLRGRFPFSQTARTDSISRRTAEVLEGTSGTLGIYPIFTLTHPFNRAARHLFEELKEKSGSVEGLNFVGGPLDANHDPIQTTKILREHPDAQVNGILITLGENSAWLDEFELSSENSRDSEANDRVFIGETAVVHKILELSHRGSVPVRFLSGHGEYDPEDIHPIRGASILANALRTNGFTVERADLSVPSTLKTDRGVLVIAGLRTMLSQSEIEALSRYLSGGGRLLLLAEDPTSGGLAPLLGKWGIRLDPIENTTPNRTLSSSEYGDHPIVTHLRNVRLTYTNPCRVIPENDDHSFSGTSAAVSLSFLPDGADGSVPVAAAVRQGAAEAALPTGGARLVVCGDSGMISNGLLNSGHDGNIVFVLRAIEWLSGSEMPVFSPSDLGTANSELTADGVANPATRAVCLGFPLIILSFGLLLYVPLARRL